MIEIITIGGDSARATIRRAGDDVVLLAFVCESEAAADRLLDALEGRIAQRKAPAPVADPDEDLLEPGRPVRVSTYAWNEGETCLDAHVVGRADDDHVLVRTRFGQTCRVHERDVFPRVQ